jgi:hypothetical protein
MAMSAIRTEDFKERRNKGKASKGLRDEIQKGKTRCVTALIAVRSN